MVQTKERILRNTKIRFRYIDEFSGQEVETVGFTRGEVSDIKVRWPEEYAELPDDAHCYLAEPENRASGDWPFHVIWEEDILEILEEAK